MSYVISWFEIPTSNLTRAAAFYSQVLNANIEPADFGGMKMAFFPNPPNVVSGALVEHPDAKPTPDGTMVYFYRHDDLDATLERIAAAGGTVVMPRTKISDDYGYMAIFIDTEGNRVALHTMQ
ncbi:VOC family protein [Sphingobacteriales bacterium UPWRP_1]|nr:hypothetical protein B6N25_08050 [Sphingobacteriales bacterium TSM_CSS]PSJ77340.1 VOC family protein [Sphingobacteriales bacterium UPWRP_1]